MRETVLVTGGAGFIGRFVTQELLARGHSVRVLDCLLEQVHGGAGRPQALAAEAEFLLGDVRDPAAVRAALRGVDAVIHLAAEVGVGQSMYAVERYVSANHLGAAVLLEALIERPVRRIVTASSMSIYGEGLYRSEAGALLEDVVRAPRAAGFDPQDAHGRPLTPVATPEWKRPALASVYALDKYVQERLTLMLASAYGMEGVALRCFNVFGPGQALSNPYTGVLAIFSARVLNGERPLVFEDGLQRRDFVHVRDVARAFADALHAPEAAGKAINIGSGQDRPILAVAQATARALGREDLRPEVLGKARAGDIRHCFCDPALAESALSFKPQQDFEAGLAELADWVARQTAVDRVARATAELEARGLVA